MYSFNDKFLIEAAPEDDAATKEDTGTNEPVTTPEPEDTGEAKDDEQPDTAMANDLVGAPGEDDLEQLKKEVEELKKKFDVEDEVERIKKRLDNLSVPDDANLNDSIYQSAHKDEIRYIKRAIRRFLSKKNASSLTGEQQQKIITELDQNSDITNQQIAAKLSPVIHASEQDIFDFIRNTDYRFRHRHHRREASVINWDEID